MPQSTTAKRTNEALWDKVKKKVLNGSKGGKKGVWSARKAQLAVLMYKNMGGKYYGKKSKQNSLVKWTLEKWNYICPKCGKGRYLPEVVRNHLSQKEKMEENKRKGSNKGKRISYSNSVNRKMRKYRIY